MKGLKITGVLLLCAMVSCKKDQLESTSQNDPQLKTVSSEQIKNSETDWSAATQVEKADRTSHTVFYTNIKAPDITAETANESLVRIFKKDNSGKISSRALPFEETNGSQKAYWYYEVSEGNIMVSVDVYGNRDNPFANSSFKYIVMDDTDMQKLLSKGITKKDLKRLSYDDLNQLNN
jgi:hypothetical protein